MSYRGIAWRRSFHERVVLDAAAVLAAASAALSAVSAVQQGEASRKSAEYQAAVAENNALAARQQAELDERRGREKARRMLASQRAQAAKGGVMPDEGSPLFVNLAAGEEAEIEALNLQRAGESRSDDLHSRAAQQRFQGAVAEQSGALKAGASLLHGASRLAGP